MAKAAKARHVLPTLGGERGVKNDGANRVSKLFRTKAAAISWGRKQSIRDQSDLVIHRSDGMIIEKDSYGRDPHPPRDRKK